MIPMVFMVIMMMSMVVMFMVVSMTTMMMASPMVMSTISIKRCVAKGKEHYATEQSK